MELIATDRNFNELGVLKNATIDLEIGEYSVASNDFELLVTSQDRLHGLDEGSLVYFNDTEYGGMIRGKRIDTYTKDTKFYGPTWRGLLEKEYIQPPTNQTHLQLRGEANTVLNQLISNRFDDFIVIDRVGASGIQISYDVRDLCLLDAIDRMLSAVDAKLEIKFYDGKLHLECVKVRDLSEELQYDDSYGLQMTIETPKQRYNHILILGKGIGTDRTRLEYYLQNDGTWSKVATVQGLDRITYKYANSNTEETRDQQEDVEDLIAKAIEKVNTENGSNTVNVTFENDNAELFDIVSSREEETNTFFKDRITKKIVKGTITNFKEELKIEYKVGENK